MKAVELLFDECRGTNIPRDFVEEMDLTKFTGIDPKDVEACQGPDCEWYWDAWQNILDNARYEEGGNVWVLYQDGSVWALCPEMMDSQELRNFGYDDLADEREKEEVIKELKDHQLVTFVPAGQYSYADPDYWQLDCTLSGDYCGSYCELANFQALDEEHDFLEVNHFGCGAKCLVMTDEGLQDADLDGLKSLLESLDSLTDYPVLDDELMYKLEFEAFQEQWEDCGRKKFMQALGEAFEDKSEAEIDEIWREVDSRGDQLWFSEGPGLSIYIDTDRAVKLVLESSEAA